MRCRLTLAVVAAFVGGSSIAAHAQAPAAVNRGGGVAGAGVGGGPRIGQQPAGTGGLRDRGNVGSSTGGILLTGRGIAAGTGGTGNETNLGGNTGGTKE